MAYKQPSSGPFKMMGSSPAKAKTNPKISLGMGKEADANLSKKVNTTPKGFNTKGGKTTTPGYSTTKAAKAKTATGGDPKLEKLKAKRIANSKAGKITKFGEGSNIIADKVDSQGRNTWGDKVGKAKKVAKKGAKVAKKTLSTNLVSGGKQILKKGAKFLGGKALGVAGMLMATSSKADQPTKGKGKREYEGGKIDFTKKK